MASETPYRVVIPITVDDNTGPGARSAESRISRLEASARNLGRMRPTLTVDDRGAIQAGSRIEAMMRKMGQMRAHPVVQLADRATPALRALDRGISGLARRTITVPVRLANYASGPLRGLAGLAFNNPVLAAAGVAGGGYAAVEAVRGPLSMADQLTRYGLGFTAAYGERRGEELMSEMREFAISTPFAMMETIKSAQRLMVGGLGGTSGELLVPMLRTIGDSVAQMGGGSADIDGIITALSQLQTAGRINAQDMKQLTNRMIPAWDYLAQGMDPAGYARDRTKAVARVKGMSERGELTSEYLPLIIQGMINSPARGAMERNVDKTVSGLASQISDTIKVSVILGLGRGLEAGFLAQARRLNTYLTAHRPALERFGTMLGSQAETAILRAGDAFDRLAGKWRAITSQPEWQGAGFLAQAGQVWDQMVYQPLLRMLSGTELGLQADALGRSIGAAIRTGLIAAFNVGDDPLVGAGVQLAKGFMSGFSQALNQDDELLNAIKEFAPKVARALVEPLPEVLGGARGNNGVENWAYAAFVGKQILGFGGSGEGGTGLIGSAVEGTTTGLAIRLGPRALMHPVTAVIAGAVASVLALKDIWESGPENLAAAYDKARTGDFSAMAWEGAKRIMAGPAGGALSGVQAGSMALEATFDSGRGLASSRPGTAAYYGSGSLDNVPVPGAPPSPITVTAVGNYTAPIVRVEEVSLDRLRKLVDDALAKGNADFAAAIYQSLVNQPAVHSAAPATASGSW